MFTEIKSHSDMADFTEGFIPLKSILKDAKVQEAIRPKLQKIKAGESLRVEGKETMTGADLIANLAVTQHYLDSAPNFAIDAPDRDAMKLVKERPVADFKPVKIFQTTETDEFEEVKQGEDYKATGFTDSFTEASVKKFGKIVRLSWETLLSDTLGELGDLQQKLIRAGKRTMFKQIVSAFAGNTSFFNGTNGNYLATGVLNEANLIALLAKITAQKDSKGNPLYIKGAHLAVPTALEFKAKRLVNPFYAVYPQTLDGMAMKFDLDVVVLPDLDDISTTGYYVFANPADMPALSHLTLTGHKGIELLVKISDQQAINAALSGELGAFKNDTLEIKARFFSNVITRYHQAAAWGTGL